jgi:hypothetical protein
MTKDDFYCALLFLGLLLIFLFAPDLYNPSFINQ